MDYAWYLFSFEGRINRARYWQAMLIIFCWMIFLGALTVGAVFLLGGSGPIKFGLGDEEILKLVDPAFYRSLALTDLPVLFFETAGSVLLLWVFFATSVKRLHDRDKSGWWMIPFFILPSRFNQLAEWLPDVFVFDLWFALSVFAFGIWGLVELYFLKGSRKTNRFGPDPLAAVDTRPRWEQMSEIEMVPHKAGPPPVWRVKPGYE